MKSSRSTALPLPQLAVLFLLVCVCPGLAQTAPPNSGRAQEPTPLERELAKFDANKDGKLDEAEKQAFLAYRANWRTEYIKKWDKNGNGVLDPEEQAEARSAWRKAYKEKLAAEAAAKENTPPSSPATKP